MNLEDVLDPNYGLQQDEWSLTKPRFGEDGQLAVIGWSGRDNFGAKMYVLKCNNCSKDTELFGEGYFSRKKGRLINMKSIPCGCSDRSDWSIPQYKTLCSRKADEIGYKFLDFIEPWNGCGTGIILNCKEHGEWVTGTITSLLHQSNGCPSCKGGMTRKADEVMIASFFASGAFPSETRFYRSDRTNANGYYPYWDVHCPLCGGTGTSVSGNLQNGYRPCACSNHRQQECFINWLLDEHKHAVAIKFGIANNSEVRIKQQNSKALYSLEQHSIHKFPDTISCKKAERECLQELECGVVLKRDMKDGWSETTWVYNLEKIIEIYERNGGIRTK